MGKRPTAHEVLGSPGEALAQRSRGWAGRRACPAGLPAQATVCKLGAWLVGQVPVHAGSARQGRLMILLSHPQLMHGSKGFGGKASGLEVRAVGPFVLSRRRRSMGGCSRTGHPLLGGGKENDSMLLDPEKKGCMQEASLAVTCESMA